MNKIALITALSFTIAGSAFAGPWHYSNRYDQHEAWEEYWRERQIEAEWNAQLDELQFRIDEINARLEQD